MAEDVTLRLPSGAAVQLAIRRYARSRSVRFRLDGCGRVQVSAPVGVATRRIVDLVASRGTLIEDRLGRLSAAREDSERKATAHPDSVAFPVLGELWSISYRRSDEPAVRARITEPRRLVVSGGVEDGAACQAALRRWLARRASDSLLPRLEAVSRETQLSYAGASIRNQRSRWGSCSSRGSLSLNCKILFLSEEAVRYVLVHELCHTLELNHSPRYWALVRRWVPELERLRRETRATWTQIPAWAHRPAG